MNLLPARRLRETNEVISLIPFFPPAPILRNTVFLMLPGVFVRSDSTLYFFLLVAVLIGITLVVAIFGDLFLTQRWFITFIVAATIGQFGALLVGQRMSEMLLPYYLNNCSEKVCS